MLSRVKYGGGGGSGVRIHCAVDLKWGEAETMAMKKTWQPTSITSEARNGAVGGRKKKKKKWKSGCAGHGETFAHFKRHRVSRYQSRGSKSTAAGQTEAAIAVEEKKDGALA